YLDFFLPVGNGLNIRVGKFVTLLGQEVINPTGNALYSHSYLFGFAIPFTHTGAYATYSFSDAVTVDFGISRGWEQGFEQNSGNHGQDANWYGVAGYLTYNFNDNLAVNARGEWFEDPDFARGLGVSGSVYEVTLGLDIKPLVSNKNWASLHIRPEIRWDYSTDPFFGGAGDTHDPWTAA